MVYIYIYNVYHLLWGLELLPEVCPTWLTWLFTTMTVQKACEQMELFPSFLQLENPW